MNAGLLWRPYQIVPGTDIASDQAIKTAAPAAVTAAPAQSSAHTAR